MSKIKTIIIVILALLIFFILPFGGPILIDSINDKKIWTTILIVSWAVLFLIFEFGFAIPQHIEDCENRKNLY